MLRWGRTGGGRTVLHVEFLQVTPVQEQGARAAWAGGRGAGGLFRNSDTHAPILSSALPPPCRAAQSSESIKRLELDASQGRSRCLHLEGAVRVKVRGGGSQP